MKQPEPLTVAAAMNETWSMGFMQDSLDRGQPCRLLNVIDYKNRERLGIELDFPRPSERVIRTLKQLIEWRGKPTVLRCDNRPEHIDEALRAWVEKHEASIQRTQPGKPQQNAYFEHYNRTVRYDWLNASACKLTPFPTAH